jgi:hypothetical protein
MPINKPSGLFDEVYEEPKETAAAITQPTTSSFFRPQPVERKIVNLFDDEPPELDDSSYNRNPVTLFDDDDASVASLSIDKTHYQSPPPVDLFNENEFDNFIKKMENRNPQQQPSETDHVSERVAVSGGVQRDMKIIADEIKKVQLKKVKGDEAPSDVSDFRSKIERVGEALSLSKSATVKVQPESVKSLPRMLPPVQPEPVKSLPKESQPVTVEPSKSQPQPASKSRPKIANLFDDDEDDSEDFFNEIMRQKATSSAQKAAETPKSESIVTKTIPEKKKIANLFDDEDEEDAFEDIFSKKSVAVLTPKKQVIGAPKESKKLFESTPKVSEIIPPTPKTIQEDPPKPTPINRKQEEVSKTPEVYQPPTPQTEDDKRMINDIKTTKTSLFDDDDEDFFANKDIKTQSELVREKEKKETEAKIESESSKIIEKPSNNEIKSDESLQIKSGIDVKHDQIESKQIADETEIKREETTHDKVPKTNNESAVKNENAAPLNTSPPNDFNSSIPYLADEPPDDEDTWETEENNYEEPEAKQIKEALNQSKSSYQIPLFDDLPPDDDDDQSNVPPVPTFDDFEDDEETVVNANEDLPIVIDQKPSEMSESDPFVESLKKTIENRDFNDQWSDFKNKIQAKTEFKDEAEKILQNSASHETSSSVQQLLKSAQAKSQNDSLNSSAKSDSFDESDRSISAGNTSNIRSKLDLFSKSLESPSASQSEPKKLPGKLNTSLKINVGALMPGARLPVIKKEENFEEKEQEEVRTTDPAPPSNPENASLLNNEATKSRAKIQVKRRPSTRKGRRSIYEKALNEQLDASEEQEEDKNKSADSEAIDNSAPPSEANEPRSSNQSKLSNDNGSFFDDEPPPLKINSRVKSVVTNKIAVFYDDEDETKKMLEEQKLREKASESEKKSAAALFDDVDEDIFGGRSEVKVAEKVKASTISKSLFDDDDEGDEGIFKQTQAKEVSQPKTPAAKKVEKPLFGDDEEDDDLFGVSKGQKKEVENKSAKLFDNDDAQQGSIIFAKPKSSTTKKQSLFGDSVEEDDDDDLFSSKPKNGEKFALSVP